MSKIQPITALERLEKCWRRQGVKGGAPVSAGAHHSRGCCSVFGVLCHPSARNPFLVPFCGLKAGHACPFCQGSFCLPLPSIHSPAAFLPAVERRCLCNASLHKLGLSAFVFFFPWCLFGPKGNLEFLEKLRKRGLLALKLGYAAPDELEEFDTKMETFEVGHSLLQFSALPLCRAESSGN